MDAFITKCQDINANFKIIVSKNGFTKNAIKKAKHYGIQTLSLLPQDKELHTYKIGFFVFGEIFYWEQIGVGLIFAKNPGQNIQFNPADLRIGNKFILEWFTNFLNNQKCNKTGWVIKHAVNFSNHQTVFVNNHEHYQCKSIIFHARKSVLKKRKFTNITGDCFYDWQTKKTLIPPNGEIWTEVIPTDINNWEDADISDAHVSTDLTMTLTGHKLFPNYPDAINLKSM